MYFRLPAVMLIIAREMLLPHVPGFTGTRLRVDQKGLETTNFGMQVAPAYNT